MLRAPKLIQGVRRYCASLGETVPAARRKLCEEKTLFGNLKSPTRGKNSLGKRMATTLHAAGSILLPHNKSQDRFKRRADPGLCSHFFFLLLSFFLSPFPLFSFSPSFSVSVLSPYRDNLRIPWRSGEEGQRDGYTFN